MEAAENAEGPSRISMDIATFLLTCVNDYIWNNPRYIDGLDYRDERKFLLQRFNAYRSDLRDLFRRAQAAQVVDQIPQAIERAALYRQISEAGLRAWQMAIRESVSETIA